MALAPKELRKPRMLKAVKQKKVKQTPGRWRVLEQGRNYTNLVIWLVQSVFRGQTKTLALSVVLNLVHLSAQAVAIYIIYWYAKQMEGSGAVDIPYIHYKVTLKGEELWLWAVVMASVACFVLSATLQFLSRKLVFDVAQAQFGRALERLVLDGRDLPDPRARLASRLVNDFGIGGLSTGARRGALIAGSFTNAIAAVIGAVGAIFFLVRVDWSLTALIIVAIVLAALFLYPLTLRAVKAANAIDKAQTAFKEESKKVIDNRNSETRAESVATAGLLSRAFMARRRVLTELVFAIEIGVTVILGAVVFYMASQAFSGRAEWAIFVAYIGALRIALVGASAAIQVFAGVSRFYPRIMRYHLFVKDLLKREGVPLASLKPDDEVVFGALMNGDDATAKIGQRVALAAADPVQRIMYALIDARSPQSPYPVGVTVVDSAGVSKNGGSIALVSVGEFEDIEARLAAVAPMLEDKVLLVNYTSMEKIGSCGEDYLLTIANNELRRYVKLGTDEADDAMKEIAALAKKRKAYQDDDEEDDQEG
jgi:hypothetical protein